MTQKTFPCVYWAHIYLRALSSRRGLRGAPEVPPLCRETQSLGQQMLNPSETIVLSAITVNARWIWWKQLQPSHLCLNGPTSLPNYSSLVFLSFSNFIKTTWFICIKTNSYLLAVYVSLSIYCGDKDINT